MSLVTESLQNHTMGISFCGKNWIPVSETKLIDTAEVSRSVWTLADLVIVTKRCDHMLTVFAEEHPSYRWILYEALFQTSLLFWNIPEREQNWCFLYHCMDQLKTELLTSWLWEIIFLRAFPSFLCSGRKHKTMILDRILLQGTLLPQWLMRCSKKDICYSIYYMCPLSRHVLVKGLCLPKKIYLLCVRAK